MTLLDDRTRAALPIFADAAPASRTPEAPPRDWTWINWTLSLLTAPAAVLLMDYAPVAVTGAPLCSTAACPGLQLNGSLFGVLYHGAAAVAALTLFLAFFFATRRSGIAVWAGGWALLAADLVALHAIF
ncbi:hypothetical protein [Mycolicibacter sinensis]